MLFLTIVVLFLVWLAITAVLIGWVWRVLSRRGKSLSARLASTVLILAAMVALVMGDHAIGKFQFDRMCKSESGLRVFRKVADVDGFRSVFASNDTPSAYGYVFAERINSDGSVTRFTRNDGGRVIEEPRVAPRARYVVEQKNERLSMQISRTEHFVADAESNQRLARHVMLVHRGGWLVRQFEGANPERSVCPSEPLNFRNFVVGVLQPKS